MFTFEDIIGYEDIKKHLQNSIRLNRLSHAYIIEGLEGSGKKLIAGTIAKTLQCEEKGDTPCNTCISCTTFDSGNHPDVIYVEQMKKKSIGVEEIRKQVQDTIDIKPYKYPYKIYIIDRAEKLTEQAQNALLKTIEEPPGYAMILLLTKNSNSFLPTILSRCVLLNLRPQSFDIIKDYLIKSEGVPDYQADIYAQFSNGSIGLAKKLAISEEFVSMKEEMISLLTTLKTINKVERMNQYKELEKYKDQIQSILDFMTIWYRDILFYKELGDTGYIMNKDNIDLIKEQSHGTYESILNNLQLIEETKYKLRRNTNFQLTMEILLLNLK
ncbi:DNA polymerase III subunit [Vallitalea okinawensis]|uniref:DNA polymerase III subunit n=1 Tax=Vallitalea okinawensis TaxID=2078660 RepID=UPI000CFB3A7F|nr:DNA polymerase III subunit delta' C-terminal domain-containing protein [Vallitalea okinawensis]